MGLSNFNLFIFTVIVLSQCNTIIHGLPTNQDNSGSKTKSSLPLDLEATESRTDAVISTAPPDEVAQETRTRGTEDESAEEDEMTAGASEDSSHYEMELMTGDEADDNDEAYSETEEDDASPESQHLFPSFSALFPPLGHSRPATFFTEPPPPPIPQRTYQTESFHRALYSTDDSERVLGSGNFGVIRGGTYYSGSGDELPFLRGPNSHSRPYRRPNPLPQYRHGGDFFAGFKDFADITTPAKPSYSQIYIVYANRNSTNSDNIGRPKNIRELLEADNIEEKTKSKSKKKLNKYKEKVAALEASKKYRGLSKDFGEPLLALS